MIVISYTLYGDAEKYKKGMLASIQRIKKEGWIPIVALEEKVNLEVVEELERQSISIVRYSDQGATDGMLKRYYLHPAIRSAECVFVRDTDSIIDDFEIQLMKEFISSKAILHTIRSHQNHDMPLMGGLTGFKVPVIEFFHKEKVKLILKKIEKKSIYGSDQKFLILLYQAFRNSTLIHSTGNYFKDEKVNLIICNDDQYPGKSLITSADSQVNIAREIKNYKIKVRMIAAKLIIAMIR